jgi:Galactose oxidase, central domain
MTLDLETRLRSDLPRLADLLEAPARAVDDPGRAGDQATLEPERPRSRRPIWFAVAACLLLLAGVASVAGLVRHRVSDESTTSVTANPPGPLDTWEALPAGPLSPREDATSVWTGSEWLVFGGRQGIEAMNDSAAYNPSSNTWRSLAVNPTMHPGAQAVWTGHVVAVLAKGGGWIYDPAADTWTDLPQQSVLSSGTAVGNDPIWTGQEVVTIGVTESDGHAALGARGLDPTTMTWGELAPSRGVMGAVAGARWDGSRVQVWLTTGEGWAYDPEAEIWEALAPLPVSGSNAETTLSITGSGSRTYVLAHTSDDTGSSGQLAVFEDGAWRLVGDPQRGPAGDAAPLLTMAGDELVLFSRQRGPEAIDPATGATRALNSLLVGPGSGRSVAWTGEELLMSGGRDTAPGTGGNPGAGGALTAAAARLSSSQR